jgi:hypothetical protein
MVTTVAMATGAMAAAGATVTETTVAETTAAAKTVDHVARALPANEQMETLLARPATSTPRLCFRRRPPSEACFDCAESSGRGGRFHPRNLLRAAASANPLLRYCL